MKTSGFDLEQKKYSAISVISFTENGFSLAHQVKNALEKSGEYKVSLYEKRDAVAGEKKDAVRVKGSLRDWCGMVFQSSDALIFIGAAGIAVRTIAPFLVSKTSDPAVLVMDERGKHVISLLSGHLGGGNELTLMLAETLGADPVITTASDVNGKLAVDVWAKKNHLVICDFGLAKLAAAEIVAGKRIPFCCDGGIRGEIPEELERSTFPGILQSEQNERAASVGILVSVRMAGTEIFRQGTEKDCGAGPERAARTVKKAPGSDRILRLIPRAVTVGIGCRRGKPCEELRRILEKILSEYEVAPESICRIASADLKKDEPGIVRLAREYQVPFETFSVEELLRAPGDYSASAFVAKITGADNICERAAMASLKGEEQKKARFICRKQAVGGVTIALLEAGWEVCFE